MPRSVRERSPGDGDGAHIRRWLVPSRDDPRNADCAEWAGKIVIVQWLLIVGFFVLVPQNSNVSGWFDFMTDFMISRGWNSTTVGIMTRGVLILVAILSFALLSIGTRGAGSGHAKQLGSWLLIVTNTVLLIVFVTLLV